MTELAIAALCMMCYAIGHFVGKWTEVGRQELESARGLILRGE